MSNYKKRVRTCLNCKNLKHNRTDSWCGVKIPYWAHNLATTEYFLGTLGEANYCGTWGKRLTSAKTGRGK